MLTPFLLVALEQPGEGALNSTFIVLGSRTEIPPHVLTTATRLLTSFQLLQHHHPLFPTLASPYILHWVL